MELPLVLDLAADAIPVAATCRVLGSTERAFCRRAADPITERDRSDAHLIDQVNDIHHDDPESGYRSTAGALTDRDVMASRDRVQRPRTPAPLGSARASRRGSPVPDDLVRRRSCPTRAYEVWLTDVTEHLTSGGELHLCAVRDAFSDRIVGCSTDARRDCCADR